LYNIFSPGARPSSHHRWLSPLAVSPPMTYQQHHHHHRSHYHVDDYGENDRCGRDRCGPILAPAPFPITTTVPLTSNVQQPHVKLIITIISPCPGDSFPMSQHRNSCPSCVWVFVVVVMGAFVMISCYGVHLCIPGVEDESNNASTTAEAD